MSRIQRPLLLTLLLGFVLGLPQAPAAAAQTLTPALGLCGIVVRGLGYTESEAIDNAVSHLYEYYRVLSYRVVASDCDEDSSTHGLDLPTCYAELSACGFRKIGIRVS